MLVYFERWIRMQNDKAYHTESPPSDAQSIVPRVARGLDSCLLRNDALMDYLGSRKLSHGECR